MKRSDSAPAVPTPEGLAGWFQVDASGHGSLTGWAHGTVVGDDSGGASGMNLPRWTFAVINAGTVGGMKAPLSVDLAANDKTTFFIGAKQIKSDSHHRTAAALVFDQSSDNQAAILDSDRKVTVRFHREGDWFYADSVVAGPEQDSGPPYYF